MPTWLLILLVTSVAVGFVYCLAVWNAKRDCRTCRIAFFAVGETAGCWLLINGWIEGSDRQVAFGSIILVVVNLWFGVRFLSSWLGGRQAQRELEKRRQEKGLEGAGMAVGATAIVAAAGADALASDTRKTGPGQESDAEADGGDLEVDVDIGLDL